MFETRAAIGTAETPAEPIRGLTLFLLNMFINLAINKPLVVPIAKATKPNTNIPNVSSCKNFSAINFDPTANPRKIVTILIKAF